MYYFDNMIIFIIKEKNFLSLNYILFYGFVFLKLLIFFRGLGYCLIFSSFRVWFFERLVK